MSFGPKPWRQQHWDGRAATNFIAGGMGAGLLLANAAACAWGGGSAAALLLGMALIATGLTSVWLEIGRPLRALNVILNPRTSWMSREAFAAGLTLTLAAGALYTGYGWLAGVAGLAALAFVYCQARMVRASRGIPAWREPALTPFMLATSLAEGVSLALLVAAREPLPGAWALALLAAVSIRQGSWLRYQRAVNASLVPSAQRAIADAGKRLQWVGFAIPAVLAGAAVLAAAGASNLLLAGAALLALAAGVSAKWTLVVRASFNQGFALPHLPVRGRRAGT